MLDKKELVKQIQQHLAGELSSLLPEVEAAHSGGRAASAQTQQRVHDIQQQLVQYRFLPMRDFGTDDVVCAGCLVELELLERRALYYIVPSGGGLVFSMNGMPVQVITPHSPLGEALVGKRLGEKLKIAIRDQVREYRIISIV